MGILRCSCGDSVLSEIISFLRKGQSCFQKKLKLYRVFINTFVGIWPSLQDSESSKKLDITWIVADRSEVLSVILSELEVWREADQGNNFNQYPLDKLLPDVSDKSTRHEVPMSLFLTLSRYLPIDTVGNTCSRLTRKLRCF